MYIPFDQLPDQARLWIYQADRPLSDQEAADITKKAEAFITEWTSHGQTLLGSGQVLHNRFLVLATDENTSAPSGCSIDASVQFIRSLGQTCQIDFFDRTKLLFLDQDRPLAVNLADLRSKISEGAISADTLFFDNMIKTAGELKSSWLKPAGKSWLSKYF